MRTGKSAAPRPPTPPSLANGRRFTDPSKPPGGVTEQPLACPRCGHPWRLHTESVLGCRHWPTCGCDQQAAIRPDDECIPGCKGDAIEDDDGHWRCDNLACGAHCLCYPDLLPIRRPCGTHGYRCEYATCPEREASS